MKGGPLDTAPFGDVHLYGHYAHEMTSGRWPYRDFFDEYPPLAQPLFFFVRLLPGTFGYTRLPDGNLLHACGLRDSQGFGNRRKVIRAGNLFMLLEGISRRLLRTH